MTKACVDSDLLPYAMINLDHQAHISHCNLNEMTLLPAITFGPARSPVSANNL